MLALPITPADAPFAKLVTAIVALERSVLNVVKPAYNDASTVTEDVEAIVGTARRFITSIPVTLAAFSAVAEADFKTPSIVILIVSVPAPPTKTSAVLNVAELYVPLVVSIVPTAVNVSSPVPPVNAAPWSTPVVSV